MRNPTVALQALHWLSNKARHQRTDQVELLFYIDNAQVGQHQLDLVREIHACCVLGQHANQQTKHDLQ